MEVLGQATVTAEIQNVRKEMTMVVVDGEGPKFGARLAERFRDVTPAGESSKDSANTEVSRCARQTRRCV